MSAAPLYVIRGGGLAGWGAAALLTESLPAHARIVVTDRADEDAPSPFDIAALPADATLLALTGLPVERLLAETGADILLATAFVGWRDGRTVFHAEQEALPALDGIAVHDLALRAARSAGHAHDYAGFHAPFRFQARAAEQGRYAPPSPDRTSPRSLLRPGVMVDGKALAALLRDRALAAGVAVAERIDDAPVLTIDTRPDADPGGWQPMPDGTGHDRCVTARLEGAAVPDTCLRVLPLDGAIVTTVPARHGLNAVLTCGAGVDDAALLARAFAGFTVTARAETGFAPGAATAAWHGDRLVLGTGAARPGAAMALDVTLLDRQLALLATLLPGGREHNAVCARAYNARLAETVGHHADLLHLTLRHRPGAGADSPPPSDRLARRLDQFLGRNRAAVLDGDPFDAQTWLGLMIALGLVPRRYDPQVERLPPAQTDAHLGRMAIAFDRTLAAMPPYRR